MIKKIVKVVLVLLILFGAVISVINIMDAQLKAVELDVEYPVVRYNREVPSCEGKGDDCIVIPNQ